MQEEEASVHLDLSVDTLALLGQNQPAGPVGEDSIPIRGCSSDNTPPTCCP